MADERDEEPKIRVVDNRMLSDDERAGKFKGQSAPSSAPSSAPKLEIIGGSRAQQNPNEVPDAPPAEPPRQSPQGEPQSDPRGPMPIGEPDEDEEMSVEEMEQMRDEVEREQFAAIEQQMGRPLTDAEKVRVRAEMEKEARSMAALEVAPILQNFLAELSARAAVHMGLMPNPYTRLVAKNDGEARLAIDAFGAVYDVMKTKLDPQIEREYARVLNDLRVNFASQTGTPIGAGAQGPRIIH